MLPVKLITFLKKYPSIKKRKWIKKLLSLVIDDNLQILGYKYD